MKSAVAISLGLNISRFVIGMTVVSFATSAPNNKDIVKGVLFNINDEELIKADSYEVKEYERIRVILKSKEKGWVYIKSKP